MLEGSLQVRGGRTLQLGACIHIRLQCFLCQIQRRYLRQKMAFKFAIVSAATVFFTSFASAEPQLSLTELKCSNGQTTASFLDDMGVIDLSASTTAVYASARFFLSDRLVKTSHMTDAEAASLRRFIEDLSKDIALLIAETENEENLRIARKRASLCRASFQYGN